MWWFALAAGLIIVGVGALNLVRYFRDGPERDRGLAGSGHAHRLVATAMLTTAGLFLSFLSLANLIAERFRTAP
jgi:hypothetical protein